MNLERGVLKNVLRSRPVAGETDQKPEQIVVVATDEVLECGRIARAVLGEKLFV